MAVSATQQNDVDRRMYTPSWVRAVLRCVRYVTLRSVPSVAFCFVSFVAFHFVSFVAYLCYEKFNKNGMWLVFS